MRFALLLMLLPLIGEVSAASGRFRVDGAAYPKPRPPDPARDFFDSGYIPFLKIELSPEELAQLRKNDRAYVKATVREGDIVYTDVGFHLKGAAGSYRPFDQNPAMTLNFDKFNREQRFHGLDKLHLNNSVQDPSKLAELITREMYNAAGVPAGRVSHARVHLNGRELGLYVLIEGYDTQFLKRHFTNWFGTFYDGGFVQDITADKRIVSNDSPQDRADLKELIEAAQEPDHAKRRERLARILDVERFLSFTAMEMLTSHWDGYAQNRNNYRLYHDPGQGRLVFLPTGLDQMFGDPNFALVPGNALVAQAIVRAPEDRERYLQRLREIYETVYDVERLTARVREVTARLQPVLEQINAGEAKSQADHANGLIQRIAARHQGIGKLLGAPVKTLPFDASGVAKLPDFAEHTTSGSPAFAKVTDGGRPALHIRANADGTAASWRTRVVLAQGRYAFQALARVSGLPVTQDVNSGAALRVSGGQRSSSLNAGPGGWQRLEHEIQVNDPTAEVVLVCELRGNSPAQAWFDMASLRLVRK